MRLKPVLFAVPLSVSLLWPAAPQPVIINAVVDQYRPLPFENEKLIGLFAARMRANSEGFLEKIPGHPTPETAGQFLEAAANAYDYRHDPDLKVLLDRTATSIFSVPQAGNAPDVLPGLLAYYRVTGQPQALSRSRQIADLFLSKKSAVRNGSMVEPLVVLFRYTGESRYLEAAKSLANRSLGDNAQSGATDDQASLARRLQLSAALVDLYRLTGDEIYLHPALAEWRSLQSKYVSLTGAVDFPADASSPASACSTVAWIQLTLELFRITGAPNYISELERTIYNQLLAGQDPRTGQVFSSVPLNGRKTLSSDVKACDWDQVRAITLLPALFWGRYGNGISINLYTGGRATVRLRRRGTVQIYSEASFPESGHILLHIEPDHNLQFPLRLRVPDWTSSFMVEFAGSRLAGKPGQYLTIAREWKRGDTVKIEIDLTRQIIAGSGNHAGEIALKRGPQVMALGATLNPGIKDLSQAALITSGGAPSLMPTEGALLSNWVSDQAYTVEGEYSREPQRFTMVPFADALNYRVFLRRSDRSPSAALQ